MTKGSKEKLICVYFNALSHSPGGTKENLVKYQVIESRIELENSERQSSKNHDVRPSVLLEYGFKFLHGLFDLTQKLFTKTQNN